VRRVKERKIKEVERGLERGEKEEKRRRHLDLKSAAPLLRH
jgi:hypothetical protein